MLNQTVLKRLLVCLQIESKSELQFRCELTYIWEMVYTLITFHQAWSVRRKRYSSCELFRSCDLFGFLCLIWDISSSTLKDTITSTSKHHRTSYPAEWFRIVPAFFSLSTKDMKGRRQSDSDAQSVTPTYLIILSSSTKDQPRLEARLNELILQQFPATGEIPRTIPCNEKEENGTALQSTQCTSTAFHSAESCHTFQQKNCTILLMVL